MNIHKKIEIDEEPNAVDESDEFDAEPSDRKEVNIRRKPIVK